MNYRSHDKKKTAQAERRGVSGARFTAKPDFRDEITISEVRDMIARRRVPLLLCVALALLVAVLVSLAMPTRYEAVARLSVVNKQSESAGMEALAQAAGVVDPTTLQTQISILQTDSLAWSVITALRLDQRAEALPRRFGMGSLECGSSAGQSIDAIGADCRQVLIDEFHKRFQVQPVPRTEVIEIRYRCKSRYLAVEVVNTMASLYVERDFQTKYQIATRNSAWLAGQLDSVRRDAESAARRLIAYQEKTGAVNMNGEPPMVLSRLTGLGQQLIAGEAERIVREARYRTALTGDPEGLINISQGTTLQVLHTQEATLQNQFAELDAQFGDAYPKVQQVKGQLAQVRTSLKTEIAHTTDRLKSEYEAALTSEQLLQAEFDKQKDLLYGSVEAGTEMSLLTGDMEASSELYKQVLKRLKTGGILAAGNGPDITIIDPATIPRKRAEPHMGLNILAGIVAGSILGFTVSVLLEGLDTRIGTMKDVAALCPVSGVGIIPCIEKEGKNGKPGMSDWNGLSEIMELNGSAKEVPDAFRSVRTSLIHASTDVPPKVILVSSPLSREGTAATSANLAAAFAQMNRRVLLVDADLRRAGSIRAANATGPRGLAEALKGEDYHSFFVARPELQNLILLPAGGGPSNSPELLDSARAREMISQWREEFDQVIIDLPRLTDQSDAVILSTMVDTVLLVVRAGRGRRNDIQNAMEVLESVGAFLHGAVVTAPRERSTLAKAISWQGQRFTEPRMESRNA